MANCTLQNAWLVAMLLAVVPCTAGGWEERPELLVPRRFRTEAEEDRVEALAFFAAGRMLERQEKHAEALRLYQRALRRDPEAATVARTIIPLAFRLKHHGEAIRYMLKAVELEEADPLLLRRLGAYLTEKGDRTGAVKLYEKVLAARAGAKETTADILLRMEMGRLYHLVEAYDKAAKCFERVAYAIEHPEEVGLDDGVKKVLLGKQSPTYALFGECFLRAGRLDDAAAAFRKSHEVAPHEGRWQFNLARLAYRRDKPAEAFEHLQACFREKSADEGMAPYELLAELLEATGRSGELLGQLEELRARDDKNVPLGYFLAKEYYRAKQFEKAEPLYRTLVEKTPTLTGYRSLAAIYRITKRPDRLLSVLGDVAEKTGALGPLGPEVQAIVGDAGVMRTMVETARRKHEAEPASLDFGMRLAVALLALQAEQFDTAAEFFELALKAKHEQAADVLLTWGLALLLDERFDEAAEVFQRAIDEKAVPKDNPSFYFYLAGALAMDDHTDEALAAARKAVEIKDLPRHHGRVAWVLAYAKRNDEAIQAYRALINKFDPDHQSAEIRRVVREARFALSNLSILAGNMPEAEEWLEQILDEFPDDIGAANDLGYLWTDRNMHLHRALKMIERAVDAEPDNIAYRDSLGWVYYRLGRHAEAVAELEKATQAAGDEPDGVILDHLGDAYMATGQVERAKDAWHKAVEAFQQQKEPEKAKEIGEKINGRPFPLGGYQTQEGARRRQTRQAPEQAG